MVGYTAAQIQAIRDKAAEIAIRGVAMVQVGDRIHRFTDPAKLEAFAASLEALIENDTHGGLIDILMGNPTT